MKKLSMKTLQITNIGHADWLDMPIPEPVKGEVLLRVEGITTCPHWDIHILEGIPMFAGSKLEYPYTPGQPGHEMAGVVVGHGPGVAEPAIGTRVAAWRDPGKVGLGCYSQYVNFKIDNLIPVPIELPLEKIASLELAMCLQVTFDQLAAIDAVKDKKVAIGGLGPAGTTARRRSAH